MSSLKGGKAAGVDMYLYIDLWLEDKTGWRICDHYLSWLEDKSYQLCPSGTRVINYPGNFFYYQTGTRVIEYLI